MTFDTFDIHDATLTTIAFEWATATYVVSVHPVGQDCTELVFDGVSHLAMPRLQPWGPSRSINSAKACENGKYEIEMQSGDTIIITAKRVALSKA